MQRVTVSLFASDQHNHKQATFWVTQSHTFAQLRSDATRHLWPASETHNDVWRPEDTHDPTVICDINGKQWPDMGNVLAHLSARPSAKLRQMWLSSSATSFRITGGTVVKDIRTAQRCAKASVTDNENNTNQNNTQLKTNSSKATMVARLQSLYSDPQSATGLFSMNEIEPICTTDTTATTTSGFSDHVTLPQSSHEILREIYDKYIRLGPQHSGQGLTLLQLMRIFQDADLIQGFTSRNKRHHHQHQSVNAANSKRRWLQREQLGVFFCRQRTGKGRRGSLNFEEFLRILLSCAVVIYPNERQAAVALVHLSREHLSWTVSAPHNQNKEQERDWQHHSWLINESEEVNTLMLRFRDSLARVFKIYAVDSMQVATAAAAATEQRRRGQGFDTNIAPPLPTQQQQQQIAQENQARKAGGARTALMTLNLFRLFCSNFNLSHFGIDSKHASFCFSQCAHQLMGEGLFGQLEIRPNWRHPTNVLNSHDFTSASRQNHDPNITGEDIGCDDDFARSEVDPPTRLNQVRQSQNAQQALHFSSFLECLVRLALRACTSTAPSGGGPLLEDKQLGAAAVKALMQHFNNVLRDPARTSAITEHINRARGHVKQPLVGEPNDLIVATAKLARVFLVMWNADGSPLDYRDVWLHKLGAVALDGEAKVGRALLDQALRQNMNTVQEQKERDEEEEEEEEEEELDDDDDRMSVIRVNSVTSFRDMYQKQQQQQQFDSDDDEDLSAMVEEYVNPLTADALRQCERGDAWFAESGLRLRRCVTTLAQGSIESAASLKASIHSAGEALQAGNLCFKSGKDGLTSEHNAKLPITVHSTTQARVRWLANEAEKVIEIQVLVRWACGLREAARQMLNTGYGPTELGEAPSAWLLHPLPCLNDIATAGRLMQVLSIVCASLNQACDLLRAALFKLANIGHTEVAAATSDRQNNDNNHRSSAAEENHVNQQRHRRKSSFVGNADSLEGKSFANNESVEVLLSGITAFTGTPTPQSNGEEGDGISVEERAFDWILFCPTIGTHLPANIVLNWELANSLQVLALAQTMSAKVHMKLSLPATNVHRSSKHSNVWVDGVPLGRRLGSSRFEQLYPRVCAVGHTLELACDALLVCCSPATSSSSAKPQPTLQTSHIDEYQDQEAEVERAHLHAMARDLRIRLYFECAATHFVCAAAVWLRAGTPKAAGSVTTANTMLLTRASLMPPGARMPREEHKKRGRAQLGRMASLARQSDGSSAASATVWVWSCFLDPERVMLLMLSWLFAPPIRQKTTKRPPDRHSNIGTNSALCRSHTTSTRISSTLANAGRVHSYTDLKINHSRARAISQGVAGTERWIRSIEVNDDDCQAYELNGSNATAAASGLLMESLRDMIPQVLELQAHVLLTASAHSLCSKTFSSFDTDKDGMLSRKEVDKFNAMCKLPPTTPQVLTWLRDMRWVSLGSKSNAVQSAPHLVALSRLGFNGYITWLALALPGRLKVIASSVGMDPVQVEADTRRDLLAKQQPSTRSLLCNENAKNRQGTNKTEANVPRSPKIHTAISMLQRQRCERGLENDKEEASEMGANDDDGDDRDGEYTVAFASPHKIKRQTRAHNLINKNNSSENNNDDNDDNNNNDDNKDSSNKNKKEKNKKTSVKSQSKTKFSPSAAQRIQDDFLFAADNLQLELSSSKKGAKPANKSTLNTPVSRSAAASALPPVAIISKVAGLTLDLPRFKHFRSKLRRTSSNPDAIARAREIGVKQQRKDSDVSTMLPCKSKKYTPPQSPTTKPEISDIVVDDQVSETPKIQTSSPMKNSMQASPKSAKTLSEDENTDDDDDDVDDADDDNDHHDDSLDVHDVDDVAVPDTHEEVESTCADSRVVDYFAVLSPNSLSEDDELTPDCNLEDLTFEPELLSVWPTPDVAKTYPTIGRIHDDYPLPGNLSTFCFPNGAKLVIAPRNQAPEPYHSGFVLTDSTGEKRYGRCLFFYEDGIQVQKLAHNIQDTYMKMREQQPKEKRQTKRKHPRGHQGADTSQVVQTNTDVAASDNKETTERTPKALQWFASASSAYMLESPDDDNSAELRVYVPICLCVISRWPFHTALKSFLDQLLRVVKAPNPSPVPIERLISILVHDTPVPPRGLVQVQVALADHCLYFSRPAHNDLPLADFSFKTLFERLSVKNILLVFACILQEKKVALCARSSETLFLACETLRSLMFPFKWRSIYIPVLPAGLLEFLFAPVSFLVGIQDSYLDQFRVGSGGKHVRGTEPNDVVFVDLENDCVHLAYGARQVNGRIETAEQMESSGGYASAESQGGNTSSGSGGGGAEIGFDASGMPHDHVVPIPDTLRKKMTSALTKILAKDTSSNSNQGGDRNTIAALADMKTGKGDLSSDQERGDRNRKGSKSQSQLPPSSPSLSASVTSPSFSGMLLRSFASPQQQQQQHQQQQQQQPQPQQQRNLFTNEQQRRESTRSTNSTGSSIMQCLGERVEFNKYSSHEERQVDAQTSEHSQCSNAKVMGTVGKERAIQKRIRMTFVQAMVQLLHDYRKYLILQDTTADRHNTKETGNGGRGWPATQTSWFDKPAFLSDHSCTKTFHRALLDTQLFEAFVDERVSLVGMVSSSHHKGNDNVVNSLSEIQLFDELIARKHNRKAAALYKKQRPTPLLNDTSGCVTTTHFVPFPSTSSGIFGENGSVTKATATVTTPNRPVTATCTTPQLSDATKHSCEQNPPESPTGHQEYRPTPRMRWRYGQFPSLEPWLFLPVVPKEHLVRVPKVRVPIPSDNDSFSDSISSTQTDKVRRKSNVSTRRVSLTSGRSSRSLAEVEQNGAGVLSESVIITFMCRSLVEDVVSAAELAAVRKEALLARSSNAEFKRMVDELQRERAMLHNGQHQQNTHTEGVQLARTIQTCRMLLEE